MTETEVPEKKTLAASRPEYRVKYGVGKGDGVALLAQAAYIVTDPETKKKSKDYESLFRLCELNGIEAEWIQAKRLRLAAGKTGTQGVTVMDCTNRLRAAARKNGNKLVNLSGETVEVVVADLPERQKKAATPASSPEQAAA